MPTANQFDKLIRAAIDYEFMAIGNGGLLKMAVTVTGIDIRYCHHCEQRRPQGRVRSLTWANEFREDLKYVAAQLFSEVSERSLNFPAARVRRFPAGNR
jgi:hypothetical protein